MRKAVDGKILKHYTVQCGECRYPNTFIDSVVKTYKNRNDVEKELLSKGWRVRDGKWLCDNCMVAHKVAPTSSTATFHGAIAAAAVKFPPLKKTVSADFTGKSTSIARILWEAAGAAGPSGTLRVGFTSGGTYDYVDVPYEKVQELLDAPSKGKYIRRHIAGKYTSYKVS
jgi:hypothetical protein